MSNVFFTETTRSSFSANGSGLMAQLADPRLAAEDRGPYNQLARDFAQSLKASVSSLNVSASMA